MEHPSKECLFSIVVPVLHEAEHIKAHIDHIRSVAADNSYEIIVVDGDQNRTTINAIADTDVVAITSPKGRACQMNLGAAIAAGKTIIFLHADTQLPPNALSSIAKILEHEEYVAGAFDLSIDSARLSLRFIAARASLRSRLTRVPYGDQAIFIRKDYFGKIGKFKEIPLMEDIDLMKRIRKKGDKIFILRDPVRTSARRWDKEGVLYTTLRNMVLVNLHRFGVRPERLARYYRNHSAKKD